MAANKKPKKKYVPRDVFYPKLITQIHSFKPFEDALQKLLDTGECDSDQNGTLIYFDGLRKPQAFDASIKTYIDIIRIHGVRTGNAYKLRPLNILHNRLFEGISFSETEIKAAKECLEVCKQIICKIPRKEFFDIIQSIRITKGIDAATTASLKESELKIAKYKHLVGDLEFEDVQERNNHYQQLHKENPNDERIKKLMDIYIDFLSAYRIHHYSEILNKGLKT